MNNRLEEIRKIQVFKQEKRANAPDISRQTISFLKNGRYNTSILLDLKIAHHFGMTIDGIFFIYERNQMIRNKSQARRPIGY